MVADRLDIRIEALEVEVSAELDLRGTLLVDRSVPVGLQRVRCCLRLRPADDTDPAKLQMLLAATEYSCVVLQTLRKGVPVETRVVEPLSEAAETCAHLAQGQAKEDAIGAAAAQIQERLPVPNQRSRTKARSLVATLVLATLLFVGDRNPAAGRDRVGAKAISGACIAVLHECAESTLCHSANRVMADGCQNRCVSQYARCIGGSQAQGSPKSPPKTGTRVPIVTTGSGVLKQPTRSGAPTRRK